MLKLRFIGRGTRLEFRHAVFRTILTSPIVDIRASEHFAMDAWAARKLTVRHIVPGPLAPHEFPTVRSRAAFSSPFLTPPKRFHSANAQLRNRLA
jgi:hypothetical protein